MATVLVIVVVVGLGVALYEVATSRRHAGRKTRSQLDALSRVVEPQRRRRAPRPSSSDGRSDPPSTPGSGPEGD